MEEIINKLVDEKFKRCINKEARDNDAYFYKKGLEDGIELLKAEYSKLEKELNDIKDYQKKIWGNFFETK